MGYARPPAENHLRRDARLARRQERGRRGLPLICINSQLPEEHIVPAECTSTRELIALAVAISLRL